MITQAPPAAFVQRDAGDPETKDAASPETEKTESAVHLTAEAKEGPENCWEHALYLPANNDLEPRAKLLTNS